MSRRFKILIFLGVGVGLFAILGGGYVSRTLTFHLLLRQQAPSEVVLFDVVSSMSRPDAYLRSLWDSEKIPHRHLAIKYIHQRLSVHRDEFEMYEALIHKAISDADFANRELAMGIMDGRDPDAGKSRLARSLRDPDQGTRLRALQFVKAANEREWMPELIRLLDDPDPLVVAHAASKLRQWTGQDFGIRMLYAMARPAPDRQPSGLDPEQARRLSQGILKWKQWWQASEYRNAFSTVWEEGLEPFATPALSVEDFEIHLLDGPPVRLSDYRGKAVLLNFWTTWCSACMTEMADLSGLHDQYPDSLQIIGISLDGGEDHGHEHGSMVDMEEDRKMSQGVGDLPEPLTHDHPSHEHDHSLEALEHIEKKVRRVVQKKALKYLVAMDPHFQIGGRFNGQELPTNVLIDSDGNLRRRFVGARPIHSWKAMLRDIGIPDPSPLESDTP